MSLRIRTFAIVLLATSSAAAQTLPSADAGDDQVIDCAPLAGADVTLDGTGSVDPDAQPLSFRWTDAQAVELSTEVAPIVPLPPGVHVLTLTVDDGVDGEASDQVTITVNADTTPPVFSLSDDSDELWPPNHKLHGYPAADLVDPDSVSDDCSELDVNDVVFGRATSDEADDGKGDGNTTEDVSFSEDCAEAMVRAERSGKGDGRLYELFLRAEDGAGNVTEEPFSVSVLHDQSETPPAADNGDVAEYECDGDGLASCPSAPDSACTDAGTGEVAISQKKKGARLRWRAQDFAAGAVSDEGSRLCLYVDGVAAGGSPDPDKLKVKDRKGSGSLEVATKGSDLEIPALPLAGGAVLRLELHDGAGQCVSASFDSPSVNEADGYEAEVN